MSKEKETGTMFSDADIRTADQAALLDGIQEDIIYPADESDVVADCFICPGCSENRVDWLVWISDDMVDCQTCGASYDPGEI